MKARYHGSLLGLALGDAFGTTLEFQKAPTKPHEELCGGGPFSLLPGQWTDDTSLALCLAESLIEKQGFDPRDQLQRYLEWYREGKLSSNGQCFDIGIATRLALEKFAKTNEEYPASTGPQARSGNGSLMRLCPIPLYFRKDPNLAIQRAADSSRTTHGSQLCQDACRYYTTLMIGIIEGSSKDQILSNKFCPASLGSDYWDKFPLCPEVDMIASGSFKNKMPPEIKGTGYVIDTMEAALWAFYSTENYKEGLIKVVNLGDDADTTGAIYGQLSGLYYGEQGLPQEWVNKLAFKDLIKSFASELFHLSEQNVGLSQEYEQIRECFTYLEKGFKPILRKLLPGPHAYKLMEQLDKDTQNLFQDYDSKISECIFKSAMVCEFQNIIKDYREKLEIKLNTRK